MMPGLTDPYDNTESSIVDPRSVVEFAAKELEKMCSGSGAYEATVLLAAAKHLRENTNNIVARSVGMKV
jgi:hypothetical protein